MTRRPIGSTPAVGSSRNRASGRPAGRCARLRRCCSPPERRRHGVRRSPRARSSSSTRALGVLRVLVVAREQRERLRRGQRRPDPAALEHRADPRARGGGARHRVETKDAHRAGVRAAVAEEGLDARRLAGAVGTKEADDLAADDVDVDGADAPRGRPVPTVAPWPDRGVGHLGKSRWAPRPPRPRCRLPSPGDRRRAASTRPRSGARCARPARRGSGSVVDALFELDAEHRLRLQHAEEPRAEVKALSRKVAAARKEGDTSLAEELQLKSRALGHEERRATAEAETVADEVRQPAPRAAEHPRRGRAGRRGRARTTSRSRGGGPGSTGCRRAGLRGAPARRALGHRRASSGMLDFERGARLSGSMFPLFTGMGAGCSRAHVVLPRHPERGLHRGPSAHARAHRDADGLGAPAQVRRRGLRRRARRAVGDPDRRGPAHLDAPRRDPRRGHRSRCATARRRRAFAERLARRARTPAGCSGSTSSTRRSCSPTAPRPRRPRRCATSATVPRRVLQGLRLQYRVLDLCAGDLGNQNARTFDLEVYAPGVDKWLEVSSVSWYRDYQARRANVRYRPSGGGSPVMAHTVNGSVLGWVAGARRGARDLPPARRPIGVPDGPRRPTRGPTSTPRDRGPARRAARPSARRSGSRRLAPW